MAVAQEERRNAITIEALSGGDGSQAAGREKSLCQEEFFEAKDQAENKILDPVGLLRGNALQKVDTEATNALMEIQSIPAINKTVIETKIQKGENSTSQYLAFLQDNEIFRPWFERDVLMKIAIMTAMFCVEASANSLFFYQMGQFPTMASAFSFGGFLALVNVALSGWVLGYLCLRHWRHPSERVAKMAQISLVPIMGGLVALLGGAAYVRATGSTENFHEVFFEPWVIFSDYTSVLVLLMGAVTAVICAREGYTMADPHPQLDDMQEHCIERPREEVEALCEADSQKIDMEYMAAVASMTEFEGQLNDDETRLTQGKEQCAKKSKALRRRRERVFHRYSQKVVDIKASFKARRSRTGAIEDGPMIDERDCHIEWDCLGEEAVKSFQKRARDRLAELRQQLQKARTEAQQQVREMYAAFIQAQTLG